MNKLENIVVRGLKHSVSNFDERNIFKKGVKVLEKILICAPSGMAPHNVQYEMARNAGIRPATQTLYSAGLGMLMGIFKYVAGDILDDVVFSNVKEFIDLPSDFLKYWGIYTFLDASVRFGYAAISKKPLGTFLWEVGYYFKDRFGL
jgi:hypothetical protein